MSCQSCDIRSDKEKALCEEESLFNALENGNVDLISQCTAPERLNPKNKEGVSLLTLARKSGLTEVVAFIQASQYGYWLGQPEKYTKEWFYFGLDNDNPRIIGDFIGQGYDFHLEKEEGVLPIVYAIFNDSDDVLHLLLAKGIDPNTEFDLRPLICIATMFDQKKMVEDLIDAGADVNKIEGAGKTALMFAAEDGYIALLKLLIDVGANVNAVDKNGETALIKAEKRNQKEVVNYLQNL